jgi:hypothetical protein
MFWVTADRDFIKKKEVLRMNHYDFLEAYRNSLEKLFIHRSV